MRVIGGRLKGRRLASFRGASIRPTADRVREAVFNILGAAFSYPRVLDLFAGTGAMGIEAMSRGASEAVFVEADPRAAAVIRKNIEACGLHGARVLRTNAADALRRLSAQGERFDVVFVDPPYALGILCETVEAAAGLKILAPEGVLVAEGPSRTPLHARPRGMELFDTRRYGDTAIYFFRSGEAHRCQST